jgi:hypothetical protein
MGPVRRPRPHIPHQKEPAGSGGAHPRRHRRPPLRQYAAEVAHVRVLYLGTALPTVAVVAYVEA